MTHYFYNHTLEMHSRFLPLSKKLTCALPCRTVIIAVEQKRG